MAVKTGMWCRRSRHTGSEARTRSMSYFTKPNQAVAATIIATVAVMIIRDWHGDL